MPSSLEAPQKVLRNPLALSLHAIDRMVVLRQPVSSAQMEHRLHFLPANLRRTIELHQR